MSLLLRGGLVVNADGAAHADVRCEGESIAEVGVRIAPRPGDRVIDAGGKLVFPGFVDPHVHVYLPFMGTFAKDDWASVSRAALVGGTTTLLEMVCPGRGDDPLEAYHMWKGKADGVASCDYGFHMGVTRFDAGTEERVRRVVADGTASLKVFLAYQGALGIDDDELYQTLELAQRLGVIVTAHCENASLVARLQQRLLAQGKTGPEWHEPSRPVQVEAEGVGRLMTFAELTGAAVYVVHASCEGAVRAAVRGRLRGVRAWVETVVPYLVLDDRAARRGPETGWPEFEGAKFVMSPPIRARRHQDFLWRALAGRDVSTVGTDHAPFDFHGQKEMGRGDFTRIPNGLPSVEHRIRLLYTHGVATGRIDLPTLVDAASTQPARLFGLYPRKGAIRPGADADLVVYDPAARETISAASHLTAADYDPFEGWDVIGRCDLVTVRGRALVEAGRFVGPEGGGRFQAREPGYA